MVNIQIITLAIIIAAVLIVLGYQKSNKYLYLSISGGVILIIIGLMSWSDPIQFQTGTVT